MMRDISCVEFDEESFSRREFSPAADTSQVSSEKLILEGRSAAKRTKLQLDSYRDFLEC